MTKKHIIILGIGFLCTATVAAFLLMPVFKEQQLKNRSAEIVAGLSTDEKIGQVMLMNFRFWGKDANDKPIALTECNDTVRELIQTYHLGNVLLFGENVQTTEGATRFVSDLQAASLAGGGAPLLICVDQEGGMVTRLGQGTCLPGNMALGASGKPENARQAGNVIGAELAAIGINCDFAPSCDVNNNPQNPVINLRSFSSQPTLVAKLAPSFRQGLHKNNVIAAAKHFPGHGNTANDTHIGLAVVDVSKEEWDTVEAVPFRAMVKAGTDMIMTAHIQFPQIDTTLYTSKKNGEELYLPATLSRTFLTDILRGELGFEGVVVTDAMDMQAIADHFGTSEASIMALAAGADLLCNPTSVTGPEDVQKLEELYADIHEALEDGRLTMERLNEAATRVVRLKLKYGIWDKAPTPVEDAVQNALTVVGSPEHRAIERKLANEGVTYHSSLPYEPMQPAEGDSILFLVPYENKGFSAQYAMNRLIQEGKLPQVEVQTYIYGDDTEISADLTAQIKEATHVVLVSMTTSYSLNDPEDPEVKMPILLSQALLKSDRAASSAVISIGLPNDAESFPGLPLYLSYGYQGMNKDDAATGVITHKYGPNLPAAIDCLMGAFKPTGTLPV